MKTLSAVILSAILATSAFGQEGPSRDEIEIKTVSAAGSGCADGSATARVWSSTEGGPIDRGEISYDGFIVDRPGRSYKACMFTLNMHYPVGWSYTVVATNVPGAAVLQEGVQAQVNTSVDFKREGHETNITRKQNGYWEGSFNLKQNFENPAWSVCGKFYPMTLKVSASLTGDPESEDMPSVIHIGGLKRKQNIKFKWRRC